MAAETEASLKETQLVQQRHDQALLELQASLSSSSASSFSSLPLYSLSFFTFDDVLRSWRERLQATTQTMCRHMQRTVPACLSDAA